MQILLQFQRSNSNIDFNLFPVPVRNTGKIRLSLINMTNRMTSVACLTEFQQYCEVPHFTSNNIATPWFCDNTCTLETSLSQGTKQGLQGTKKKR